MLLPAVPVKRLSLCCHEGIIQSELHSQRRSSAPIHLQPMNWPPARTPWRLVDDFIRYLIHISPLLRLSHVLIFRPFRPCICHRSGKPIIGSYANLATDLRHHLASSFHADDPILLGPDTLYSGNLLTWLFIQAPGSWSNTSS